MEQPLSSVNDEYSLKSSLCEHGWPYDRGAIGTQTASARGEIERLVQVANMHCLILGMLRNPVR